jgi:hypothetical protein
MCVGDILCKNPIKHSDTKTLIPRKYFSLSEAARIFFVIIKGSNTTGIKLDDNLMTCFDKHTPEDRKIN